MVTETRKEETYPIQCLAKLFLCLGYGLEVVVDILKALLDGVLQLC